MGASYRKTDRAGFFRAMGIGILVPFAVLLIDRVPGVARLRRYLRPPGALAEKEFLNACIGCGQCANVCPNKCIQFVSLEKGLDQLATPVIIARSQGCILCMACIHMPQAIRVIPAGQTRRKEPG